MIPPIPSPGNGENELDTAKVAVVTRTQAYMVQAHLQPRALNCSATRLSAPSRFSTKAVCKPRPGLLTSQLLHTHLKFSLRQHIMLARISPCVAVSRSSGNHAHWRDHASPYDLVPVTGSVTGCEESVAVPEVVKFESGPQRTEAGDPWACNARALASPRARRDDATAGARPAPTTTGPRSMST